MLDIRLTSRLTTTRSLNKKALSRRAPPRRPMTKSFCNFLSGQYPNTDIRHFNSPSSANTSSLPSNKNFISHLKTAGYEIRCKEELRKMMMMMPDSFVSCFRSRRTGNPTSTSAGSSSLTTSFYHTAPGIAVVTWDRTLLGRSLSVELHFHGHGGDDGSSYHHLIHLSPWLLWKKGGSKSFLLRDDTRVQLSWDFRRVKFHDRLEPASGFYLSIIVDGEETLLVGGDSLDEKQTGRPFKSPALLIRQEHLFGDDSFATKVGFRGKMRDVSILYTHASDDDDPRLTFCVDQKKVLQVKRLKWKFRGNEMTEVDGVRIQVSWDVYNWLFSNPPENKRAVFLLRIEDQGEVSEGSDNRKCNDNKGTASTWWPWETSEKGGKASKRAKSLMKTSSSSSFPSVSSLSSSSVMEWSTAEEIQLQSLSGFSLLVYAWRK